MKTKSYRMKSSVWAFNRDCITLADRTSTCFDKFDGSVHQNSPVNLCGSVNSRNSF